MNLVVLAHPRFCEDLARLIVEIMVPDEALDRVYHEMFLDHRGFAYSTWFAILDEAEHFMREVERRYKGIRAEIIPGCTETFIVYTRKVIT